MLNATTSAVRRLCVSIAAATPTEALALAQKSEAVADVLEIRLDGMAQPDPSLFVNGLAKPLVFTNRPTWEGGSCAAEEQERLGLLKKAAEAGAGYVDLELNADPTLATELIGAARANNCQTIVSWHDFKCTASRQALTEIFQRQCRSGADIGNCLGLFGQGKRLCRRGSGNGDTEATDCTGRDIQHGLLRGGKWKKTIK